MLPLTRSNKMKFEFYHKEEASDFELIGNMYADNIDDMLFVPEKDMPKHIYYKYGLRGIFPISKGDVMIDNYNNIFIFAEASYALQLNNRLYVERVDFH
jgi:hypothetical protein